MEVLLRPSLLLLVVYKGDERLSYKGLRHGPFYLIDYISFVWYLRQRD